MTDPNGKPEGTPRPVAILEEDASERAISALAVRPDEPLVLDVQRSLPQAAAQFRAIQQFVKEVLKDGIDFGTVTGIDKPFLFKAGAEKLCALFGYAPIYVTLEKIEDWGERRPNGFFFYRYRCDLVSKKTGVVMGSGIGSCNSLEERFRWTQGTRICPECKKATIIKGKKEFDKTGGNGGWICWSRKEIACGAKWPDGAKAIEGQSVERVEREAFSQANNVDKQSQKRALTSSTLIATGTSGLFTQDEDTVGGKDGDDTSKPATVVSIAAATAPKADEPFWRPAVHEEIERLFKAPSENGNGRTLNRKELPPGCKYKGGGGEDKFMKMVDAGIHGGDPTAEPVSVPAQPAPPAVTQPKAEQSGGLDQEIAQAIAKGGWTVARTQVCARRLGATDGNWKAMPQEMKQKLLGVILDTIAVAAQ
jgi:hypothetical protein